MTVSKSNLGQVKIRDDYFQGEEGKNSLESRLYRWSGLANVSEGWTAYQKNDYRSALKSGGIGLAKIGTIAAACYGVYRWAVGHVVHINDFITQAENDFNAQSHRSFVPSSVVSLTDAFYDEQKTFAKWPKSGKEFVFKHLASDAPMSSAIIKYLIKTAEEKGDSSLKRPLIKECKTGSSASCVTVAESYTGEAHPDALSNAMSLLGQCRKSKNAFCDTVIENAKKQSLKAESLPDIVSILRQIAKRPEDIQKNRELVEKGISLFQPHVAKLQAAIEDCQKARPILQAKPWAKCPNWWRIEHQSPAERLIARPDDCVQEKKAEFDKLWGSCYSHAGFIEKLEGLDMGYRDWWQERYLNSKTDQLTKTIETSLSDQAVGLAEFCSKISGSYSCQRFTEDAFQKLVDANLSDEAMKLMMNSNGALIGKLDGVLEKLGSSGKWNEAIKFLLSFAKFNPKIDLANQAKLLWGKVIQSNNAFRAFELLSMNVPLDIKTTLEKAFENRDENHLHRIYSLGKLWIAKKDAQYDPHLKFIIKKLFEVHSSSWSSYSYLEDDMAKVLVTKWMHAKNPNSILASTLSWPNWSLRDKPDSQWDRYSDEINKNNWEQKLNV